MWRFGFSVLYFWFFKSRYLIFGLILWIPVSTLRELKFPILAWLTNQSCRQPLGHLNFRKIKKIKFPPSTGQKTAQSPRESKGIKYPGVNSGDVETSIWPIKLIPVLQSDYRYRAFNKHRRPTKHVGYRVTFFPLNWKLEIKYQINERFRLKN